MSTAGNTPAGPPRRLWRTVILVLLAPLWCPVWLVHFVCAGLGRALRPRPVQIAVGLLVAAGIVWVGWQTSELFLRLGAEPQDLLGAQYDFRKLGLPAEPIDGLVTADGLKLRGWIVRGGPETVVLVHGAHGSHREMVPHAEYLWKAGYTVVFYDNRSRGESEGEFVTFGVSEPGDVLAVVGWLHGQQGVEKIGLQGISLGGASSIIAAARSEDPRSRLIEGIVAECPFPTLTEAIDNGIESEGKLPRIPFALLCKWIGEWRLNEDLDGIRPADVLAAVAPRPVLLIHDANEVMFSEETFLHMAAKGGPSCTAMVVPMAKHGRGWQTCAEWARWQRSQGLADTPNVYEQRVLRFWGETLR